jgi:hypothetical protein
MFVVEDSNPNMKTSPTHLCGVQGQSREFKVKGTKYKEHNLIKK